MSSFEHADPTESLPGESMARPSLTMLLRSDRDARLGPPPGPLAAARSWPAFVLDPSLRACFLLRLTMALPRWAAFVPRNLLVSLHRIDCLLPMSIGPGLRLPHARGIVFGRLRAGRDMTLHEGVTFGGARPGIQPLIVGDRVTVHARSTVLVDAEELPSDSVIGPDQFIFRSIWVGAPTDPSAAADADDGGPPRGVPATDPVRSLLYADYVAAARTRVTSPLQAAVMLVRFVSNPSLHACVLLRLAGPSGHGPSRLWRAILRAKHGIDLQENVEIAGGLDLPHPFEIVFGTHARIGAFATLAHRVTFDPAVGNQRVIVGDHVAVYQTSTILAGAEIGDDVTIGAYTRVSGRVASGTVHRGPRPTNPRGLFVRPGARGTSGRP